jgi:serine/threonine-protein kinase RsbW
MDNRADRPFFEVQLPSTFESVASAMNQAVSALFHHEEIDPDDEAWVRLCLEEALVNAVRHGNRCEPNRIIRIEMLDAGEDCLIHVYDEGNGFYPENIQMPGCEQLGGRGVCIMRHFMNHIRYDLQAHRLEMSFHRRSCCKGGPEHGGS